MIEPKAKALMRLTSKSIVF